MEKKLDLALAFLAGALPIKFAQWLIELAKRCKKRIMK